VSGPPEWRRATREGGPSIVEPWSGPSYVEVTPSVKRIPRARRGSRVPATAAIDNETLDHLLSVVDDQRNVGCRVRFWKIELWLQVNRRTARRATALESGGIAAEGRMKSGFADRAGRAGPDLFCCHGERSGAKPVRVAMPFAASGAAVPIRAPGSGPPRRAPAHSQACAPRSPARSLRSTARPSGRSTCERR